MHTCKWIVISGRLVFFDVEAREMVWKILALTPFRPDLMPSCITHRQCKVGQLIFLLPSWYAGRVSLLDMKLYKCLIFVTLWGIACWTGIWLCAVSCYHFSFEVILWYWLWGVGGLLLCVCLSRGCWCFEQDKRGTNNCYDHFDWQFCRARFFDCSITRHSWFLSLFSSLKCNMS